jgi:1-deoxy-D-xylulose-5-phosphate reductoisomerase
LPSLDFEALSALHFKPLKREEFPCYDLALRSIETGGSAPCALNGAGEVAVRAFLEKKISFLQIAETIEGVMSSVENLSPDSYEALAEADRSARAKANEIIKKRTVL